MVYSLSQLKRDAKEGKIKAEMVIQAGGTDVVPRCQGIRKLVDANSVAIIFLNADGKRSELRFKRAKLIEYTDDKLTSYYPAERPLNEREQKVMDGWKAIADTDGYKQQLEYDCMCDGTTSYWRKQGYFAKSECPYLNGHDESQGCRYNQSTGLVIDYSMRGRIENQYKLYR